MDLPSLFSASLTLDEGDHVGFGRSGSVDNRYQHGNHFSDYKVALATMDHASGGDILTPVRRRGESTTDRFHGDGVEGRGAEDTESMVLVNRTGKWISGQAESSHSGRGNVSHETGPPSREGPGVSWICNADQRVSESFRDVHEKDTFAWDEDNSVPNRMGSATLREECEVTFRSGCSFRTGPACKPHSYDLASYASVFGVSRRYVGPCRDRGDGQRAECFSHQPRGGGGAFRRTWTEARHSSFGKEYGFNPYQSALVTRAWRRHTLDVPRRPSSTTPDSASPTTPCTTPAGRSFMSIKISTILRHGENTDEAEEVIGSQVGLRYFEDGRLELDD